MSDIQYVMVMHDGSRATKFMSEDYCKDLMAQLAAAQSGEVCTKPHADDVLEFCQACKIESLQARLAEAERVIGAASEHMTRHDYTEAHWTLDAYSNTSLCPHGLYPWNCRDCTPMSASVQPPPVITFPDDMSTAERIGDPRIDGQPDVAPCEPRWTKEQIDAVNRDAEMLISKMQPGKVADNGTESQPTAAHCQNCGVRLTSDGWLRCPRCGTPRAADNGSAG